MSDNSSELMVDPVLMLQALTDGTGNYAYLYNFSKNIYTLSDGMACDFGLEAQGPGLNNAWAQCAQESDRARLSLCLQQALSERQTTLRLEYRAIDAQGRRRSLAEQITLHYHAETGAPQLLVSRLTDRGSSSDIERFSTCLKAILDATPLCLNLWNSNFENTMCNQEAVKLFDLADEQAYQRHFFELSPPYQPDGSASRAKSLCKIREAFEHGRAQFFWTHCNLKGERIPAEITLVRIDGLGDDGAPLVAGFTRDIRAQMALQRAQEHATQRTRAVLDSMPLSCILWTLDMEILDCNQGAVSMLGAQDKQEIIRNFDAFNPTLQPDGSNSLQKKVEKFKETIGRGFNIFEWVYRSKEGKEIPSEITLVKLTLSEEELIVAYSRDLRELYQTLELNDRLAQLAYHDPLTGCASRARFMERLEECFRADSQCASSMIIFDVDFFKEINDNYGHTAGDIVLRKVVKCAEALLPHECMLGRFGGDEFLIQCRRLSHAQLQELLEQLVCGVSSLRFQRDDKVFSVSISAGASFKAARDETSQQLLERTDKALYNAKARGRNCYVIL